MLSPKRQGCRSLLRLLLPVCLAALAGCHSVPYARDGVLPARIDVADGSAQRTALNARTYDAAIGHARRLFYRDTANFTPLARRRRASVIARPDESSFYSALNEVLGTLDDAHSHAMGPGERAISEQIMRDSGKESGNGYGLIKAVSGKGKSVLAVVPGSAASEAGILPGWQLLSIDGRPLWMHQERERQPARFLFMDREGRRHEHDLIPVPSPAVRMRESRYLPGGLLYLHWKSFDDDSLQWLHAAFSAAHGEDTMKGMVIDLRGNAGGLARVGAEVYAMLDGKGVFAWLKSRQGQDAVGPASPPLRYGGALLVLVDAASASTAELLAARLQETGRAVLIGETTAGAVVASRGINLPDGGLLSLGMREIRTGDGRLLEGTGVTPDLPAPWTPEAIREGRDPAWEVVTMFVEELAKSSAGKGKIEDADENPAADDKDI